MKATLTALTLAALSTLSIPVCAQEAGTCGPSAVAWAGRCAAAEGISVLPITCPEGGMILHAALPNAAPLKIEIARARADSFQRAGDLGLAPIGEFADWNKAPAPLRQVFDKVTACAQRESPFAAPPKDLSTHAAHLVATPSPPPWLPVAALLFAAAAFYFPSTKKQTPDSTVTARPPSKRTNRSAVIVALLFGLTILTYLLRRHFFPPAFFRQTGLGAMWVEMALGLYPAVAQYGPGYRELFGWWVSRSPGNPEAALFALQSLLGAAIPVSGYVIARASGSKKPLAFVVALLLGANPLLARIAESESYYATTTALLFIAAALLLSGATRFRHQRPRQIISTIAAGLLVAQACRVSPICWTAAATLPVAVLAGPGKLFQRFRQSLLSAAIIAAVLALTSAAWLLDAFRNGVGVHGTARALHEGPNLIKLLVYILPCAFIATAVFSRSPSARLRIALLALVIVATQAGNIMGVEQLWIKHAYVFMFAPALCATFIAAVASSPPLQGNRRKFIAPVILLGGFIFYTVSFASLTALPTDALECRLAWRFRDQLPAGATLSYLESAGQRNLKLPIYNLDPAHAVELVPLRADAPAPTPPRSPNGSYYYRSSLCEMPEGQAYCVALEAPLALEPIAVEELPALGSVPSATYIKPTVRVGLYRIHDRDGQGNHQGNPQEDPHK